MQLYVERQAGRQPVGIHLNGIPPLGLEKNLVARFVLKADNFVFNRRAIARPPALNGARKHWRAVEAGANSRVRLLIGIGQMAWQLTLANGLARKRQRRRRFVPVLGFEPAVINRPAVESRTGAGFQATELKAERGEVAAQPLDRKIPRPAGGVMFESHMNQTLEKGSGGENDPGR